MILVELEARIAEIREARDAGWLNAERNLERNLLWDFVRYVSETRRTNVTVGILACKLLGSRMTNDPR